MENSAQENHYMNNTISTAKDELVKSPGKNASRNCLKKSSSQVKKHHNDINNCKPNSNSIIYTSSNENKQVLNSQFSNITNLKDKNQINDIRDSQKRKSNNEDSQLRERDLNSKHKSPICEKESRDKGYKWEIVYKKEDTSPVNLKYKNSGYVKKKGVCLETRTRKK